TFDPGHASWKYEGGIAYKEQRHDEDQDHSARGRRLLRREPGRRRRLGDACGRAGSSRFGSFRRPAAGSLGLRAVPLLLATRASLLRQALLSALWLLWTAVSPSLGTAILCAFLGGWIHVAILVWDSTPATDDSVFGQGVSIWRNASEHLPAPRRRVLR